MDATTTDYRSRPVPGVGHNNPPKPIEADPPASPASANDPLGVLAGRLNISLLDATRALEIGKPKTYERINAGLLIRKKMGRGSVLTVESVLRVAADGVPAVAAGRKAAKPPVNKFTRKN